MIKAVILDYDGTLIDNMQIHYDSFVKALEGRKKITPRELFLLEGGKVLPITSTLVSGLNLDNHEIDKIIDKKRRIYEKSVKGLRMRPEALRLVRKLRKLNYKVGLATGSPREVVAINISPRELQLFDHVTTSDETRKPKPDPEPYLKCVEGLGVKSEECVAIDNAPLGVESAKSAGMICIALTSTVTKEDLKRADFVIDSLKEAEDIIKKL
jgi:beta-phosphoglucomutase